MRIGGEPAAELTLEGTTRLRFVTPPHAKVEAVDLSVENPSGLKHRLPAAFSYRRPPPRVASVSPAEGPNAGATRLTVRGAGFVEGCSALVCGLPAAVTWKGGGEIEILTPPVPGSGLVDVRVMNPDDQACTAEKVFRYDAPLPPPSLEAVSPSVGSQAGGLKIALLGERFAEGVVVRLGGALADVRFLTHKELSVVTPPFARAGEVDVEVVNPDGAISRLEGAFTYEALPAPAIISVSPQSGPSVGGTKVVIEGAHFTRECQVFVGRERPKDTVFKSATEIHIVTAPRKAAGSVDVEVSASGGPRAAMKGTANADPRPMLKNGFRYDAAPPPAISSVSPVRGGPGGGTEVTISGQAFLRETEVLVDGKPVKSVKLVDRSTLELKMPPGASGKMVDVTVRNPDGKEAVQKRAFLYDPRYG